MTFCGEASAFAKVAVLLIVAALALHCAGYGTMVWQHTETIQTITIYSIGLWKIYDCSGSADAACSTESVPDRYVNSSFQATRAFESIILIILVVAAVLLVLYVASKRFREVRQAFLIMVLCFVIAFLGMITMIIWIVQIPDNHYAGYSFGLVIFAFALASLAGALLIPDVRRYSNERRAARHQRTQKVVPTPREDFSKYDTVRNEKYGRETPPMRHESFKKQQPAPRPDHNRGFDNRDTQHYYNPHREPHTRTPPPKYSNRGYTPDDIYLPETPRHPRRY